MNIENVQNIFKLELPDYDKFQIGSLSGEAKVVEFFKGKGSVWAVQNKDNEWGFFDGSYKFTGMDNIFEKSDVSLGFKLGISVQLGVDLSELLDVFNSENYD